MRLLLYRASHVDTQTSSRLCYSSRTSVTYFNAMRSERAGKATVGTRTRYVRRGECRQTSMVDTIRLMACIFRPTYAMLQLKHGCTPVRLGGQLKWTAELEGLRWLIEMLMNIQSRVDKAESCSCVPTDQDWMQTASGVKSTEHERSKPHGNDCKK